MSNLNINADKPIKCEIESLILERSSDVAEQLTELECKNLNIYCYNEVSENEFIFTEEAQEIFNIYYDEEIEKQTNIINTIFNLLNELKCGD